jgi:hypothetical protein
VLAAAARQIWPCFGINGFIFESINRFFQKLEFKTNFTLSNGLNLKNGEKLTQTLI